MLLPKTTSPHPVAGQSAAGCSPLIRHPKPVWLTVGLAWCSLLLVGCGSSPQAAFDQYSAGLARGDYSQVARLSTKAEQLKGVVGIGTLQMTGQLAGLESERRLTEILVRAGVVKQDASGAGVFSSEEVMKSLTVLNDAQCASTYAEMLDVVFSVQLGAGGPEDPAEYRKAFANLRLKNLQINGKQATADSELVSNNSATPFQKVYFEKGPEGWKIDGIGRRAIDAAPFLSALLQPQALASTATSGVGAAGAHGSAGLSMPPGAHGAGSGTASGGSHGAPAGHGAAGASAAHGSLTLPPPAQSAAHGQAGAHGQAAASMANAPAAAGNNPAAHAQPAAHGQPAPLNIPAAAPAGGGPAAHAAHAGPGGANAAQANAAANPAAVNPLVMPAGAHAAPGANPAGANPAGANPAGANPAGAAAAAMANVPGAAPRPGVPGAPGANGLPGGGKLPQLPSFDVGSAEYTAQKLVLGIVSEDLSDVPPLISEKAIGTVASLREGKTNDGQLKQWRDVLLTSQFQSAKGSGATRSIILQNKDKKTITITLIRESDGFKVKELLVKDAGKR